MRIAILHSGDLNSISRGGVDRYIKSLILFCEDNEITVFGTTKIGEHTIGKEYEKEYYGKKYNYIAISNDAKYPLSFYYMLKEYKWIKYLGENFDCIYAQRTEYSIPFLFSKHKVKLIQMIHGSSKYSDMGFGKKLAKVHLLLEKIAISVARKTYIILSREEFGVPYYQKKYPKYADRIKYGKNLIDTRIYHMASKYDSRKELGLPLDKKMVLFSGRVEHNPKRVLLFPDICRRIVPIIPDFLFVVIGDGNDKNLLEKKIKKYGLEEKFSLVGYIDDPKIIALYNSASDAVINISKFEGTCTSNLEAIACGIPVMSTDVGDINECIFNNENGIIIPNDIDENIIKNATNAIVDLIEKPIKMNDVYKKYSGSNVINEFKHMISEM